MIVPAELELLVYWMTERDSIRRKKEAGEPKPWTTDELLRDNRWCNVRRMDDRVSRWLFEHWYGDRDDVENQLVGAAYARLINWPDALAEIEEQRNPAHARPVLQARAKRGAKVFTGAYVVPGVPGKNKVDSVLDLIEAIDARAWAEPDARALLKPTMRETWLELLKFDGLGSFLAGQIVADLAHLGAGADWPDRQGWAPVGPGSARGLNRLLGRPKDQRVIQENFVDHLGLLMHDLFFRVRELWTDRRLQAMDIQNCLCEFDKYRRLQLGEGKVRNRYPGLPSEIEQRHGSLI